MSKMYSMIQGLNDRHLELEQLLTDFDKALADRVEIETTYDDETGRHRGTLDTFDEDGIRSLEKIYERLEQIIQGD